MIFKNHIWDTVLTISTVVELANFRQKWILRADSLDLKYFDWVYKWPCVKWFDCNSFCRFDELSVDSRAARHLPLAVFAAELKFTRKVKNDEISFFCHTVGISKKLLFRPITVQYFPLKLNFEGHLVWVYTTTKLENPSRQKYHIQRTLQCKRSKPSSKIIKIFHCTYFPEFLNQIETCKKPFKIPLSDNFLCRATKTAVYRVFDYEIYIAQCTIRVQ